MMRLKLPALRLPRTLPELLPDAEGWAKVAAATAVEVARQRSGPFVHESTQGFRASFIAPTSITTTTFTVRLENPVTNRYGTRYAPYVALRGHRRSNKHLPKVQAAVERQLRPRVLRPIVREIQRHLFRFQRG